MFLPKHQPAIRSLKVPEHRQPLRLRIEQLQHQNLHQHGHQQEPFRLQKVVPNGFQQPAQHQLLQDRLRPAAPSRAVQGARLQVPKALDHQQLRSAGPVQRAICLREHWVANNPRTVPDWVTWARGHPGGSTATGSEGDEPQAQLLYKC